MWLYVIHLDEPVGASLARHYSGCSADLPARLRRHAAGRGARLLRRAMIQGIGWQLASAWLVETKEEALALEHLMKRGGLRRYCCCCTDEGKLAALGDARTIDLSLIGCSLRSGELAPRRRKCQGS